MIKYIFDVDGVLCDTGQLIDDEFSDYFQCWSKDKTYYLVTGSHKEKTIDQIGRAIPDHQEIGFHCIGNAIYPPAGGEVLINEFEFTEGEMNHFYKFWSKSIYDQKPEFDTVIEKRQGYKVGCIEEIAYRNGLITKQQLLSIATDNEKSGYGKYLKRVLNEK